MFTLSLYVLAGGLVFAAVIVACYVLAHTARHCSKCARRFHRRPRFITEPRRGLRLARTRIVFQCTCGALS